MTRKLLLALSITWLITLTASPQTPAHQPVKPKHFQLTGTITGHDTGVLVLSYNNDHAVFTKDTAIVTNGKFSFKGSIEGPSICFLTGNIKSISTEDPNRKVIFIVPADMKISLVEGDFQHAVISGSQPQQDLEELDRLLQPSRDSINILRAIQQRTTAQNESYKKLYEQLNSIKFTFVATHPNSFASPYIMTFFHSAGISLDSAKRLYSRFSPKVKNSPSGRFLKQTFIDEQDSSPYRPAIDFTSTDLRGNTIRLSTYKGKSCVLLDFWGSWCAPCRALSPHIRELYTHYHKLGLEVISISDDIDPDAWKKAIEKDSIGAWINIGNNKKGPSSLYKNILSKYSINAYPTLILIDKKGQIVYRSDKSTDTLEQAIQKALLLPASSLSQASYN